MELAHKWLVNESYYILICYVLVTKDIPAGQPNLHIWDMHGKLATEYVQKKQEDW